MRKMYFITTSTKGRREYFRDERLCALMVARLRLSSKIHNFRIYAYAIMYDHIHILLGANCIEIRSLVFSIKKQFSMDANVVWGFNKPYIQAEQALARFPDALRKRIKDHDCMVKNLSIRNSGFRNNPQKYKFDWTPSFHSSVITNEKDFQKYLLYILTNHIHHKKDGYPENYKYVWEKDIYTFSASTLLNL